MAERFFSWDDIPWQVVDEHAARKVMTLENVMCVMFRLKRGGNAPAHSHPHEQLATVLEGRLIAHVGDEQREIGPMEGYRVPPDVPHRVTIIEDAVVLDCFSPIREDFV